MAIPAGNLSWYYFQLFIPPRQGEHVLLNFIFDDLYWYYFGIFLAGPFFPAVMRYITHQGRVSVGQLCDLQMRPIHVATRTAIYGSCTIVDDATALR